MMLLAELNAKGAEFEASIEDAEGSLHSRFLEVYQLEHRVWLQTVGLLAKCYDFKSQFGNGTPNLITSKQTVYFATYVQGVVATKRCIIEGHYAKAAAMLKQDVEIFARVREIQKGCDVEGDNPNVKHLPDGSRMLYGALNNLAHPGNTHLLEEHLESIKLQSDSNVGLSPIPIFNSETAKGMCELHVHLCFQMIREFLIMLARVHGTSDSGLDELVNELNGLRLQIAESLPHSVEPASKPL